MLPCITTPRPARRTISSTVYRPCYISHLVSPMFTTCLTEIPRVGTPSDLSPRPIKSIVAPEWVSDRPPQLSGSSHSVPVRSSSGVPLNVVSGSRDKAGLIPRLPDRTAAARARPSRGPQAAALSSRYRHRQHADIDTSSNRRQWG